VSGGNLLFAGNVDTRAPNGTTGTLLLDPDNLTVEHGAIDANVTAGPAFVAIDNTTRGRSPTAASYIAANQQRNRHDD
jgi:hypothetical protein